MKSGTSCGERRSITDHIMGEIIQHASCAPVVSLIRKFRGAALCLALLGITSGTLVAQTPPIRPTIARVSSQVQFTPPECTHTTRLDIGVRYLYGGEADYLTEDGIFWASEPVVYVPHRSRTDMVMIYIGVAFGR